MLPKLPNNIRHSRQEVIQFGGLNLTADNHDGEFTRTLGITTAKYPYITQMPAMTQYTWGESDEDTWNDPYAMYAWNGELYVIQHNGDVYKWSSKIGTVSAPTGSEVFAVINTKLVIFPEKVYIDLESDTVNSLISKTWTGSISVSAGTTDATVTGTGIGSAFAENDTIDIIQGDDSALRMTVNEITSADAIKVSLVPGISSITAGNATAQSSVPDLDYICSSNNRLWGCCRADNTVYVSALGDPTDFFSYGNDTGAYTVAVGSENAFTGICEFGGAVCVWKEKILHKFLGSYPSEYYMTTSLIDGVLDGSYNSLIAVNGILYYMGRHGMYAYGGNRPQLISQKMGVGSYTFGGGHVTVYADACCATDGHLLYVSCIAMSAGDTADEDNIDWPGGSHLFVYDLYRGLWVGEEDGHWYTNMASTGTNIWFLAWDDARYGEVNNIVTHGYQIERDREWLVEMVPVNEQTFNRKGYTRLLLRLDMKKGSKIKVYAKEDKRQYREVYNYDTLKKTTVLMDETVTISGAPASFTNPGTYEELVDEDSRVVALLDSEQAWDVGFDAETSILDASFTGRTVEIDFANSTVVTYDSDHQIEDGTYAIKAYFEDFDNDFVTRTIPIRLGRCDRYQIKMEGTGEVTIRGLAREHVTGSEIN